MPQSVRYCCTSEGSGLQVQPRIVSDLAMWFVMLMLYPGRRHDVSGGCSLKRFSSVCTFNGVGTYYVNSEAHETRSEVHAVTTFRAATSAVGGGESSNEGNGSSTQSKGFTSGTKPWWFKYLKPAAA